MKQFNTKPQSDPVYFTVDDDKFEAIPANQMPGGVLDAYFKKIKEGEVFEAHLNFFKFALTEESYTLFEDRYANKSDHPITITMLGEIATWLLGSIYMGEVSEPEAPSSSGPQKKQTRGSMDGAPQEG